MFKRIYFNNMENKKVKKENSIIKITINKIKEENKEKINDNTIKRKYNELIEIVDKIFKKGIRNRTQKDISELNEFLNIIKYKNNMKEEIEEEHLNLNQLIFFSTQFMTFKKFNKRDIIYHQGDNS